MFASIGGTVELQALFFALALGVFQLLLAATFSVLGRGLWWGVGPRDEGWPPIGKYAARLERAYKNFLETFPFFVGAVLLAHVLGKSTVNSVIGTQIYFWARVLYIPAYVSGIPIVRTILWAASIVGIMMVLRAIWPGW
jgi:uncharacterized MAPEG superfamily protein